MSLLIVYLAFIGCSSLDQPDATTAVVVRIPAPRPDTGSKDFALRSAGMAVDEAQLGLEDTGQAFLPALANKEAER